MSTKTTFKRIALVAVAALGFGMLSAVPSSAVAATYTSTLSTNASSFTVVGAGGTTNYAIIEISTTDDQGDANVLFSGESITARVVTATAVTGAAASTVAKTDLSFDNATGVTAADGSATALAGAYATAGTAATAKVVANHGTTGVDMGLRRSGTATDVANTYFVAVRAAVADLGSYVVRLEVRNAAGNITATKDVTFTQVTSALDSGAKLSVSTKGVLGTGAMASSTLNYIRAGITDANGGLLRVGANGQPGLTVTGVDVNSVSLGSLTAADTGVIGGLDGTTSAGGGLDLDGSYGITGTISTSATTGTATITARYGAATAATGTITLNGAAGANYGTTTVTATGKVASGNNYILPLSTKSASSSVYVTSTNTYPGVAATGATVYYTVAYTAAGSVACVTADMSPTAGALTKAVTDANGLATATVTSANPADGCIATITWSNVTAISVTITGVLARSFLWQAPVATTVVSDPNTGATAIQSLLLAPHTVTWSVLDQFSAPMVGKTVTFTMSGPNKPTAGLASAVTDAKGQVSYTWTDAAAIATETDKVYIATANGVAFGATTGGPVSFTYKAALSVVGSVTSYYGTVVGTQAIVSPSTNIGGTTGMLISANDQLDQTGIITAAADPGTVFLKFSPLTSALAAVSGIPMTITVTGSAKMLDAFGYLTTSRVMYGSANTVSIIGLTTGVATVTATMGTVTKSTTINFVNAAADARVLTVTESAGLVTATVKDFNGNAVSGVNVTVVGSGGAWLGGGSTSTSYATASDGTVTFSVTGAGTVTASLASTYTKASFLAGSGDSTGTVVTTGAPAGVRSASVTTLGRTDAATAAATAATAAATAATAAAAKAGADAVAASAAAQAAAAKAGADAVAASAAAQAAAVAAAEAAADAAAEATDAANAATDAANASAEAGDAATAAAQDAADAVAALSTQVSEMISALKAQLTALTNLVIKIQKKVKA